MDNKLNLLEYPAIVLDINAPTEKPGHLKVNCPDLWEKYDSWVPAKSMHHSASGGFFILPEKGDVVTISLKMGDFLHPQWDFSAWLTGKLITEAKANYPDSSVWKYGEVFIELNRKDGIIKLINGSTSLELDQTSKKIKLVNAEMNFELDQATKKISLTNGTESLSGILKEILTIIKTSKTPTSLGPQVIMPDDIVKVGLLEARINTLFN